MGSLAPYCIPTNMDCTRRDSGVTCKWSYAIMTVLSLTPASYVSTWKEFAQNVLNTPEASYILESKAMEETRNGAAIMVPKLVWITRKV